MEPRRLKVEPWRLRMKLQRLNLAVESLFTTGIVADL
jgi:hypothetical protein